MTVIKPKLTFFQVQIESLLRKTIELGEPPFGETPKAFNAVHMALPSRELIFRVIDPVMVITVKDQAIIGPPAIGMNGASFQDFTLYYRE